jgi:hypothetical protein
MSLSWGVRPKTVVTIYGRCHPHGQYLPNQGAVERIHQLCSQSDRRQSISVEGGVEFAVVQKVYLQIDECRETL